ncbi:MAG TPA: nucleotide sugar dehydrogenase [Vicinamibacterales bacterium]|jgi:GDP-mannose 6-dehydrogenase|nr:nucleotide sugar dehydrogenase [Vicinamibacterales bacterium]
MRISVFGLGYVGCVTAACFAKAGHEVVGVDVNPDKVAMINAGRSPIVEPGLGELIEKMVAMQRLRAVCSSEVAVQSTELALICVGTPARSNGTPDFSAVERVGEQIGHSLRERAGDYIVVLRSTVLPGTTAAILQPALLAGAGPARQSELHIAVNPEFMREGSSLRDFAAPPLTLVGCESDRAVARLRALYMCVNAPFVRTGVAEAEMMKYVSNTFHALKVCFANEIADLCAALGADPQEVTRIFLMDRKLNVSDAYLRPGYAFGGSCLPKDLRGLLSAARTAYLPVPLLSAIVPSNEAQIRRAVDAVLETHKRRVGVVGLAFKAGTDDLRESPMVALVETLIGKGCQVRIFDRNVSIARLVGANRRYIDEEIPHISSLMCDDLDTLLAHAEVLVIGNIDADSARALSEAGDHHAVIDLTRGAVQPLPLGAKEVCV